MALVCHYYANKTKKNNKMLNYGKLLLVPNQVVIILAMTAKGP